MTSKAVQTFRIEERTTDSMWYEIKIISDYNGELVEVICRPTMQEAILAFELKGYKKRL